MPLSVEQGLDAHKDGSALPMIHVCRMSHKGWKSVEKQCTSWSKRGHPLVMKIFLVARISLQMV